MVTSLLLSGTTIAFKNQVSKETKANVSSGAADGVPCNRKHNC